MKSDNKLNKRENLQELTGGLRRKQSNVLPPDLIENDRDINEALWHGSTRAPLVQRVGAFVIGFVLLTCGLAAASIFYQHGARLWLIPHAVIAAAGLRVMYKSIKGRANSGRTR